MKAESLRVDSIRAWPWAEMRSSSDLPDRDIGRRTRIFRSEHFKMKKAEIGTPNPLINTKLNALYSLVNSYPRFSTSEFLVYIENLNLDKP